jgi:hypothetical protein
MGTDPQFYDPVGSVGEDYLGYVREITGKMWNGEAGFLFGAGLSAGEPSGLPLADELAKRLLRRAFKGSDSDATILTPDPELDAMVGKVPFEAILSTALGKLPNADTLLSFLKAQLRFDSPEINAGHQALLKIRNFAPNRFPLKLFTTNFDLLLEYAFRSEAEFKANAGQVGPITVVKSRFERLAKATREKRLAIVHLHGALALEVDEAKDIWQAEDELVLGRDPLLVEFTSQLSQNIFVMVGCSLSDLDLRRSYSEVSSFLDGRSKEKKTYIVSPVKTEREYSVAKEAWSHRRAVFVPVTATRFLEDLAEVFTHPDTAGFRQTVKDAWPKAENAVKEFCRLLPGIREDTIYEYLYHQIRRGKA